MMTISRHKDSSRTKGKVFRNTVLEIISRMVEPTIKAITEGAHTGQIGDGKIFVLDLPECIRIRTGEKGNLAIG